MIDLMMAPRFAIMSGAKLWASTMKWHKVGDRLRILPTSLNGTAKILSSWSKSNSSQVQGLVVILPRTFGANSGSFIF
tara:strand:- start:115 stop:348 length:234 start_codon:yes stop_codon:yes gene_type:complete